MNYILVTPAKNEEDYIRKTLDSVINQTVQPQAWAIVSDASEDDTDTIIKQYARHYPFIKYLRLEKTEQRNFNAKVRAFNTGYNCIRNIEHQFIGNLDADISFEPAYFQKLEDVFHNNPLMGIAGGLIVEKINDRFVPQSISDNSVAGAVQLFRRECFEDIGGYTPLKSGGIDSVAEIKARAKNWHVATIRPLQVRHYRRVITGSSSHVQKNFRIGMTRYALGYAPLFYAMSCLSKLWNNPVIIGSLASYAGYCWAFAKQTPFVLEPDIREFLRHEQKSRLRSLFRIRSRITKG